MQLRLFKRRVTIEWRSDQIAALLSQQLRIVQTGAQFTTELKLHGRATNVLDHEQGFLCLTLAVLTGDSSFKQSKLHSGSPF